MYLLSPLFTVFVDGLRASHYYQEFVHQLKMTRRRREQQYVDDNLFNHKSRTAMMVKWQVGADHRSQRLSSLLHSGRTRTPGSDVWYFCSRLRAVKLQ